MGSRGIAYITANSQTPLPSQLDLALATVALEAVNGQLRPPFVQPSALVAIDVRDGDLFPLSDRFGCHKRGDVIASHVVTDMRIRLAGVIGARNPLEECSADHIPGYLPAIVQSCQAVSRRVSEGGRVEGLTSGRASRSRAMFPPSYPLACHSRRVSTKSLVGLSTFHASNYYNLWHTLTLILSTTARLVAIILTGNPTFPHAQRTTVSHHPRASPHLLRVGYARLQSYRYPPSDPLSPPPARGTHAELPFSHHAIPFPLQMASSGFHSSPYPLPLNTLSPRDTTKRATSTHSRFCCASPSSSPQRRRVSHPNWLPRTPLAAKRDSNSRCAWLALAWSSDLRGAERWGAGSRRICFSSCGHPACDLRL